MPRRPHTDAPATHRAHLRSTRAAGAMRMDVPRGLGGSRSSGDDRLRGLVPGRYQVQFHGARGPLLPANRVSPTVGLVEGEETVATLEVLATAPPK